MSKSNEVNFPNIKKSQTSKLVFGIDCDEVLAKFKTSAFTYLKSVTGVTGVNLGKKYNEEEIYHWDFNKVLTKEEVVHLWNHINESPTFVSAIEPFADSIKSLPKLAELGEIFIVTAPLVKCHDFMKVRNKWIYKHFKIEPNNICYLKRKEFFACDLFIDDHPENVIEWKKRNKGQAILWKKPYNENTDLKTPTGDIILTNNWDDVLEIARKLSKNVKND